MDIAACPRCGSLRLALPSLSDGGLSGITAVREAVCQDCGFQGTPLLFASVSDLNAFRHSLAGEAPATEDIEEELEPTLDLLEDTRPPRARGAAVFIALVGLALALLGGAGLLGAAADVVATPFVRGPVFSNLLRLGMMAVLLAIGLALLRVANRLWKAGAPGDAAG